MIEKVLLNTISIALVLFVIVVPYVYGWEVSRANSKNVKLRPSKLTFLMIMSIVMLPLMSYHHLFSKFNFSWNFRLLGLQGVGESTIYLYLLIALLGVVSHYTAKTASYYHYFHSVIGHEVNVSNLLAKNIGLLPTLILSVQILSFLWV